MFSGSSRSSSGSGGFCSNTFAAVTRSLLRSSALGTPALARDAFMVDMSFASAVRPCLVASMISQVFAAGSRGLVQAHSVITPYTRGFRRRFSSFREYVVETTGDLGDDITFFAVIAFAFFVYLCGSETSIRASAAVSTSIHMRMAICILLFRRAFTASVAMFAAL